MKSYTAHRNKIDGFKDVAETVKMVEKISASSVHFLKQNVSNLNSYTSEVEKVLTRLSLFCQNKDHLLLKKRIKAKKALIILTGNKGLVGDLWNKVIDTFLDNSHHYQSIILIGTKEEKFIEKQNIPIIKSFSTSSNIPQKEEVEEITRYIFNEFEKKLFSQIDVVYPQFISLAKQQPNLITLLPFSFNLVEEKNNNIGFPIFEPSKQNIFDSLLQKYIKIFFYKIIMETKLSELSARTVTMEHASVKTKELIKKLNLNYLKEQRRIITQEQLESFASHKII